MSMFGKKRNANSISCLIVFIFGVLFLTACFPDFSEKEIAFEKKQPLPEKSSAGKNKTKRLNENPFLNAPAAAESDFLPEKNKINGNYGKLPLKFESNQGQFDPRVKFTSRGKGYNFFITQSETVLVLNKIEQNNKTKKPESTGKDAVAVEQSVVRMQFAGIDKNNKIYGIDELPGKSNYFTGSDRAKWKTNISQYSKIKQEGLYPGVDVIYYGNQNKLEYDLLVQPNADPKNILLKVDGIKKSLLDNEGNLVLKTGSGDLRLSKPVAYQLIDGQKHTVESRYVLIGKNKIGFEIGEYDKSQPLTIDPIIDYSTYIGGTSDDYIKDILVDSGGNVFATGYTYSTNFPTKTGSYRTTSVGAVDIFVFKLNATGTDLIYSTYIGGSSGNDYGNSIAIDSSGNVFIAGTTGSTNFPVLNARQPTYGGGSSDAFVLKLNSTGSALLFSTYHGGSAEDFCNGIAVDSSGSAYLTGGTISQNFPVLNAYQSTLRFYEDPNHNLLPSRDIFISKFNSTGTLVYSTYLGGDFSYTEFQWRIVNSEHGNGIAVDSSGNAYVTGVTNSKSFPMVNAVDGPGYDRNTDAFVVKLNPSGNGLIYSTYLSGNDPYFYCCIDEHFSSDEGVDIAVDASGSAYIVGNTQSGNFPLVNAYQSVNKSFDPYVLNYETSPHNSLFVTKFSPAGNSLEYSTYLGGSGLLGGTYYLTYCAENASSIAVDSTGSAYVTGNTCSWDFPLSNQVIQPRKNNDFSNVWDAFVTKLTPNGSALDYSTYFGYEGFDRGTAIAVDASGNTYFAGVTSSNGIPLSAGTYQNINRGGYEGFVTKILNSSNGVNITGRVTKPDGTGTGYAIGVRITGPITATVSTDYYGYYTFHNLAPNQTYTVTPLPGFLTFQPESQTFNNLTTDATADFTVNSYQISGYVTEAGVGVAGITMNMTGSAARSVQTDENGYYLFTDVLPGSYTVTPSKIADPVVYTFTPPSRSFSNINTNQTGDFTVERTITSETVAIADAYIQDGTSATTNFGTATTLKSQKDSKTNNGKNFDSYLKFDLTSVNRDIKSAKLRIYAASSTTGSVTTAAYSVSSVNWIESGTGSITWNNKPAIGGSALPGASATVTGTSYATYDIDVTNYIKSEKTAGRNIVSLALHNPSNSTVFMTANSREASGNKPRLVITTSGGDNIAPSVTMTAPANGSSFTAPASVAVSASAADADGAISRVDFYNGTTLIGTSSTPVSGNTYSINWTNVPAGSYVLTAIAYDDKGAQATAVPVNIAVNAANNPPAVSIIAPANNSTFAVGSNIGLSATATDADGNITKVEFFAGSTLVGTATTPGSGNNYAVTWTNAATGNYALTAKATDNSGGVTTSSAININVVGQIGLSPTADSYMQDGSSATTNFGTATELRTQVSAASGSNRETYLKYDLTAATGITKAVLKLYGRLSDTSGTNVPISIYPVSTTTWIESGSGSITWNNKPAAEATVLASATVTDNTARWYEFDITSYVQTEKAAGRNTVSFAVKGNGASSPYVTFNSKEAATNQPQLIMQTTQPRDVLLVVGSTSLNTGDNAVKTRLQNLGFTVTVKAAGSNANSSIKATDANGKALVLVSSTVTPANVGTKLKDIPVPVLNWEFDLADDFGMTNTVSGSDFGTASSQTQSAIVTPSHPMSAGLTGTQTLVSAASAFSWGKPNVNSVKIASLTTDSTKLVIYGYDAGKAMFGLESPARRVAVYLSDTTAASLTTNGGLLFDAAVKWACEIPVVAPSITSLSPSSGSVGTAVTITGTNFGAVQGASSVTFNGVPASITIWSNTSIGTVVPIGAVTGNVVVSVSGVASNGMTFTVTNSNGDSDGDGLPDWWEMQYFGHLNFGANDDPDGDGVTNLQEYLQGRNPTTGTVSNPGVVDLRVFTPLEP